MGRVKRISVRNYRSFSERVTVDFPDGMPLVILGENNSGKSNLVSAMEIVLGERWPKSQLMEANDFHGRTSGYGPIQITVDVEDVWHTSSFGYASREVTQFDWQCEDEKREPQYTMTFKDGRTDKFVSNETRSQCFCMAIGADRRLSYQLSYASQFTFLSKLMRKFHNVIKDDEGRLENLQNQFKSIVETFKGVPEFRAFTSALVDQLADLSANFEYRLDVDFSAYDPSNYFRSLRVLPNQDGQPRSFDELGTGQEQILAIAFAWAYATAFHGKKDNGRGGAEENLILVIEEPEAHLHPLAQRWLARRVKQLAAEGLQIILTTHSPAFLDVMNLDGFVLLRKEQGQSTATQLSAEKFASHCRRTGAERSRADSVLPFYAAAVTETILEGLFARKCVLVEGATESLALPVLLARAGLEVLRNGISIVPVGGVGNLAKWYRFFTAYGISTYVIMDSDSRDDRHGYKRVDVYNALSLDEQERTELDHAEDSLVKEKICLQVKDFETSMRTLWGEPYLELERQARDKLGLSGDGSKPLVARYVVDNLTIPKEGKGIEFLRNLAATIERL